MNEAAALPITGGSVVRSARSVLRPPPTPTRHHTHFPEFTGYRTGRSDDRSAASPGRGGPPQFPPPPSERSAPSTPGSSSGLHSRLFTPSVAFAVKDATRLPLPPTLKGRAAITTRQASLDATDRSVAPPCRALDAGLRPGPFPDRAASLLPGLLAATRTGLTPAGDDELMLDHDLHLDLQLWAHSSD